MANETVVDLQFDPIFGTVAKKKLVKDSEKLGKKSGGEFSSGFKSNIKGIGSSLKTTLAGVAKSAGIAAAAIATVGTGLLFKRAISESTKLQDSLVGLKSVAGAFGISADVITKQAQSLAQDGLIPLEDVTASLKNLIVNFDGDLQKSVETFNALKNAAAFNRQGTLALGEAIRGASEGLKNDLSIKVDNAGVTKNLSILQKEYAASIGTTIGKLTPAQKAMAEYVGITKEASIFQGDYNRLITTFNGAMTGLSTSFRFLLASFGDIVTRSPAVITLINAISNEIRLLTAGLKTSGQDGFKGIILGALKVAGAINKYIIRPLGLITNTLALIGTAFNTFKSVVLNNVASIANGIISLLPDALISDRLKAAAEGFKKETFAATAKGLFDIAEQMRAIGNTETADAIEAAIARITASVTAATPALKKYNKELNGANKGTSGLASQSQKLAKVIGDTVGRAITKTASLGIQALTKSLILGQKGFENFGKQIAGVLGSMAIQLGETLIFTGIGMKALLDLSGATAIAAGAGLIALGTILKSFSGDGGGAAVGGGGGGGDAFSGAIADTPVEDELQEPAEPDTKVAITVQGDIFDSDETGVRIASILEDAALNQNVKVVGFA